MKGQGVDDTVLVADGGQLQGVVVFTDQGAVELGLDPQVFRNGSVAGSSDVPGVPEAVGRIENAVEQFFKVVHGIAPYCISMPWASLRMSSSRTMPCMKT